MRRRGMRMGIRMTMAMRMKWDTRMPPAIHTSTGTRMVRRMPTTTGTGTVTRLGPPRPRPQPLPARPFPFPSSHTAMITATTMGTCTGLTASTEPQGPGRITRRPYSRHSSLIHRGGST